MIEDDASPSPSSAEYLESPHEAKRKALMRQLEKKGLKDQVKPGASLKQLKLTLLKAQLDKTDTKTTLIKNEKTGGKIATKTREQEIEAEKLTIDTQQSAEQLAKQGAQDEKAEEQLKADEVQSEDA